MNPFSDAKMNRAGALVPPSLTSKSVVGLFTCPVGAPSEIETVSATLVSGMPGVAPRYSVETSLPASETQTGDVGLKLMPQAFTRSGSWICATPGRFDTRFVWT